MKTEQHIHMGEVFKLGEGRVIIERCTCKSLVGRWYLKSYDYMIHKGMNANREDKGGLRPGVLQP